MKTIVALGGGGARGLAHLGVLKALEEANIKIDQIVGCSFGALIGGMYAQTPDAEFVEDKLRQFMETKEFNRLGLNLVRKHSMSSDDFLNQLVSNIKDWVMINLGAQRLSLLKSERLRNAIDALINDMDITETAIPFACNTTDLITGKPYLFTEGNMRIAITASASIPGYFPPIDFNGKKLVDGAITYNLPINFARSLMADFVIGVDVHPYVEPENNFRNLIDVILRAKSITANTLSNQTMLDADILICPPVKDCCWYEFNRFEELFEAGYQAGLLSLNEIKQWHPQKRHRTLRRQLRLRL